MELTESDKKKIETDPILSMLLKLGILNLDDNVSESYHENTNKLHWIPEKGIFEIQNPENDIDTTYPLDVSEMKGLFSAIKNIYNEASKLEKHGISIINSSFSHAAFDVIYNLLSYLFDDNVASYIAGKNFYDEDSDNIAYDIIDYINTSK